MYLIFLLLLGLFPPFITSFNINLGLDHPLCWSTHAAWGHILTGQFIQVFEGIKPFSSERKTARPFAC